MKLKMIIVMFLFLMSFSVLSFASQYSDKSYAYSSCSSAASANHSGTPTIDYFCKDTNPNTNVFQNGYEVWYQYNYGNYTPNNGPWWTVSGGEFYTWAVICPAGNTWNESLHICDPAVCIAPQIRSTVGPYIGTCVTVIECRYPETDQGDGTCSDYTCPVGQSRNPSTTLCQTPPTCGSTQAYDIYSNTCYLKPLNCPGNTHANTANDACLADAPLACPAGEHDDGTYNCVADTKAPCTSAQQSGYINGVHQCIKKTNAEQAASDLSTAKLNQQATQLAADNAAAALAADPNNTTKQAANTAAQAANVTAQANVTIAKNDADSKTLQSIDQSLKGSGIKTDIAPINDVEGLDSALKPAGPSFGTSAIDSMSFVDAVDFNPNTTECQGVPMHYKMLSYDFDPCEKLALWRTLFGWFAYVWTAFSIVQLARRVD